MGTKFGFLEKQVPDEVLSNDASGDRGRDDYRKILRMKNDQRLNY